METKLDQIKSSITISLGLKNRLRRVKGNMSYEAIIAKLLREQNTQVHEQTNAIEFQQLERAETVFSLPNKKILFSYNQYNHSPNFVFDISISAVRLNGTKHSYSEYMNQRLAEANDSLIKQGEVIHDSYWLYFQLVTHTIKKEIEQQFKHKGRFEDYYSWEEEFKRLGLSKKAFRFDVMDKLKDMEQGVLYQ